MPLNRSCRPAPARSWRDQLDAPFDTATLKRIDSFSNPEVLVRFPLLGLCTAAMAWMTQSWVLIWLYLGYVAIFAAYARVVRGLPARIPARRFHVVAALGSSALAILPIMALYLYAMPQVAFQYVALILFFATNLYTVAIRAAEHAFVQLEMGVAYLAAAGLVAIEYSRSGTDVMTLAIGVCLLGYCCYATIALLQVMRLRSRIDAAHEGQRVADKQRAIGQLTGGVAHDFNNLLTVVLGNLQLYREIEDPSEREVLLQEAEVAAQRGAQLTGQLLAFSRKSHLVVETTTVRAIFEAVLPMIGRLLPASHEVDVADVSDVPPIRVDPAKLQAVLLNLMLNARDAMPHGGTIRIAACASEALGGPGVTILVRDSGIGIAPENLERVLEPFFTTKPIGQGSGLGLSMARGFTEQSGGRLEIVSTLGSGTEVLLHFPQAAGAGAAASG